MINLSRKCIFGEHVGASENQKLRLCNLDTYHKLLECYVVRHDVLSARPDLVVLN